MKPIGRIAFFAAVASCLIGYTAAAQSTPPPAQNQSNPPAQSQAQSQNQDQDQYTGVSHPPSDDTIEADEDANSPAAAPAPAPAPRPSAAIPLKPATPPPAATSTTAENPDYGIVTGAPAPSDGPSNDSVVLHTRADEPDYGIVSYVPDNANQLAEGTNIRVRLSEDLSTADSHRGTKFQAVVEGNVYKDGQVIIPVGSVLRGEVTEVSQGHHLGPHATIRLRPDEVVLPNGTSYQLLAEVVQSYAPGTKVNTEGGVRAGSHYRKDAIEYGAGAGTGAAAGAVIAGPVGAGVGSLVGTGAVTAHMFMSHPEEANLPQGSVLIFSLTEPMELTAAKN